MDHLQGVQRVLEGWGEKKEICLVGLYHSIYGSELFVSPSLPASVIIHQDNTSSHYPCKHSQPQDIILTPGV